MLSEKETRKFLKDHRGPAAAAIIFLAACMLAVPPIILSLVPGGWAGTLLSAARLTALYAFTFIFMNIVSGALAPWFYAVFKARGENIIHFATGSLGFLLALSHGLIVITQRYYRSYNAAWILGPVALGLLACTVWVALDRDRLKKAWRAIHQINYVIFVTVYIHALWIGIDLRGSAAANALLVVFSVYVGVAALALLIRLRRYQLQAAGKKETAAAARLRADEASELAADRDTPSA